MFRSLALQLTKYSLRRLMQTAPVESSPARGIVKKEFHFARWAFCQAPTAISSAATVPQLPPEGQLSEVSYLSSFVLMAIGGSCWAE